MDSTRDSSAHWSFVCSIWASVAKVMENLSKTPRWRVFDPSEYIQYSTVHTYIHAHSTYSTYQTLSATTPFFVAPVCHLFATCLPLILPLVATFPPLCHPFWNWSVKWSGVFKRKKGGKQVENLIFIFSTCFPPVCHLFATVSKKRWYLDTTFS